MAPNDKDTTKNLVRQVLEKHEKARNSDAVLYEKFYEEHVGAKLLSESLSEFLKKLDEGSVADFYNLRRIRAVIQNTDNEFLPSDPEVRKKRRQSEEDWNEWILSQEMESVEASAD